MNNLEQHGPAQVWCDVGGTFTDCFVVIGNEKRFMKVLSSGIMKGAVDRWTAKDSFVDGSRCSDPDGFWVGSTIRWIGPSGDPIGSEICSSFRRSTGELTLEGGLNLSRSECIRYEIHCALEAPVLATRLLTGIHPSQPLPELSVRLGTTRGTNALLTRTGEPCALVTTKGFADLLRIGYQERPDLFALTVRKRQPLHDRVVEIEERLAADGSILVPLDLKAAENVLQQLFATGIRSIAVCLLHSYCNPVHELAIEQLATKMGFSCICVSSQISPKIKAVMRAETSLVDAYLTPIVQSYLQRVAFHFGMNERTRLRIMTSSGGLVSANAYRGKDSVLSGPAGGAVAIEAYAQATGIRRCIGLDMGGTSTDVCRIDGKLQLENETIKAGVRMMVPTLAIHTVAAGGGSVCWFDGVQLRVGPKSAGADPGPACYGRGGPLTITDLNLLSGRIDPNTFPFALDRHAALSRLHEVLSAVNSAGMPQSVRLTSDELIVGLRRIANEHMAAAVRSISIAQGADPREHALVGFGGAAGQHICEIADILGVQQIIDPPQAGLLSAFGIGMASVKRSATRAIYLPLDQMTLKLADTIRLKLQEDVRPEFEAEDVDWSTVRASLEIELKYVGTEGSIMLGIDDVSFESDSQLQAWCSARFDELHRARFGYIRSGKSLEVVSIQAEFSAVNDNLLEEISAASERLIETTKSVCMRDELQPGQSIRGPSLIVSSGSTTAVDANWTAEVLSDRTLILRRSPDSRPSTTALPTDRQADKQFVDPVLREVLAQRIAAIADQMGIVLEQTAMSVNVKDRRDFSCAVFAANGDLIANAPHVPVHLGAMSQTIRCVIAKFPRMQPGDCFITNDPYQGGSHLPDITVITPVFYDEASTDPLPDFFVACRAHHAEIGGIAPGSMAPTSTRLVEEGVIIPPMHMVEHGIDRSADVEALLRGAIYPSRSVAENMADLAAQQAANQRGVHAMCELSKHYGVDTIKRYMEHIQSASEAKTRSWIGSLGPASRSFTDQMDDGTVISVRLNPIEDSNGQPSLEIDFAGTGPISCGNLNANPAIVSAAVMYVIRCASTDSLPLNSGVLRCIALKVPEGILNPKPVGPQSDWPAVAGGNVETSQRVVDCLLGALGLAAASQGTMNNFLFGDASFGYYETIGGGTGATIEGDGENAVHSHMTNTRLTDVEILEKRYPVRLIKFGIRQGSGGAGKTRGGNGLVRQVLALKPLDVSLVTSRRSCSPFGLMGGQPGRSGENWHVSRSGQRTVLPSAVQLKIEVGDSILIETPGGGGMGQD